MFCNDHYAFACIMQRNPYWEINCKKENRVKLEETFQEECQCQSRKNLLYVWCVVMHCMHDHYAFACIMQRNPYWEVNWKKENRMKLEESFQEGSQSRKNLIYVWCVVMHDMHDHYAFACIMQRKPYWEINCKK